jgi:hypothetical protein
MNHKIMFIRSLHPAAVRDDKEQNRGRGAKRKKQKPGNYLNAIFTQSNSAVKGGKTLKQSRGGQ